MLAGRSRYTPDWASLDSRPIPPWYEQARFGIKIHWGPYAVPGYGALGQYAEQYARFYRVGTENCGTPANPISGGCRTAEFHNRVYGKDFKYEQFAAQFNPVLYNASEWVDVFRRGGAQYVYMTAKHSDGFALWPSVYRHGYNSVATIGRDLFGELMQAVEGAGLRKGIFYEMEDYFNFGCSYAINASGSVLSQRKCPWGGSDEGFPSGWAANYVETTMIPELKDLVNRYEPHYLYADGDWSGSDDFLQTKPFLSWLFNESPVKDFVVVNDRWGNTTRTHHGDTYLCEYDPTCRFDHPFAVTQGFGKSFGYNRLEEVHTAKWCDWNLKYGDGHCPVSQAVTQKDADECCTSTNTTGLVHLLVRTVSKSGNLEINFGPAGDGRLPTAMVQPLLGTGRWLQTNGEAIYNTTGFPFGRNISECSSDTPAATRSSMRELADSVGGDLHVDKCFTTAGDNVFVIYLNWPAVPGSKPGTTKVTLDHLKPTEQTTVHLLGNEVRNIVHKTVDGNFEFEVPNATPAELRCDLDLCHAFVFKISHVATSRSLP